MSDLFLTVCTTRQLPQALALGESVGTMHPTASFVIGLADDSTPLSTVQLPYSVVPVSALLDRDRLHHLSGQYTPTEFVGAVKPTFIRAIYQQHTEAAHIIYLDPNSVLYQPLVPVLTTLPEASALLTPFLSHAPADDRFPDEKYLQNIGLYNADFLALRRTADTDALLAWWEERVQNRAFIHFCESLCLDQIWLMHASSFFGNVVVAQDVTWHRGLWNWHEGKRAGLNSDKKPLWFNFKGLFNQQDGFFTDQTRLNPDREPTVQEWLRTYRRQVDRHRQPPFDRQPAYGLRPEKPIVFGWRRQAVNALRALTHRINTVPLPVWK